MALVMYHVSCLFFVCKLEDSKVLVIVRGKFTAQVLLTIRWHLECVLNLRLLALFEVVWVRPHTYEVLVHCWRQRLPHERGVALQ